MTETELIQGCINKREDYQKLLFDRYSGKMMAVCNRYTNNKHQAQDIFQEAFIKVFNYIQQYRFEGSFEGWMRRVFISVAMREISKQKKMLFSDIEPERMEEQGVDPEIISKMSEAEIHALVRSLPDGYRTVFNLNVIEGYSHEEIAVMLKIKASTSRVQLVKAKRYLQALMLKKNKKIGYEQYL